MLVIAGGPLANVLYSYVVFLLLLTLGGKEKIAYHAWPMGFEPIPFLGIEAGDRILAVNGEPAYHPNLLDIQKVAQGTYTLTILREKIRFSFRFPGHSATPSYESSCAKRKFLCLVCPQ
jgi:membrane-associated protease RseP (regulator of RpoE activity)